MSSRRAALAAAASLVAFFGAVVGLMVLGGVLVHAVDPARNFDVFYSLHKWPVLVALLAVSVIWLVPPYPWAKHDIQASEQGGKRDGANNANADGGPQVLTNQSTWARAPPQRDAMG